MKSGYRNGANDAACSDFILRFYNAFPLYFSSLSLSYVHSVRFPRYPLHSHFHHITPIFRFSPRYPYFLISTTLPLFSGSHHFFPCSFSPRRVLLVISPLSLCYVHDIRVSAPYPYFPIFATLPLFSDFRHVTPIF